LDIRNTIKLQFRIGETLSAQMGDPVIVAKEDPRQYVLIEDVKAEDTQGVKPTGTTPDTKELQTALENSVRDELIDAVRSKVKDLPDRVYAEAKSKEQDDNLDGAAEAYLRFLSCANPDESTERQHASSFLAEHFNFQPAEAASQ
jgi:aminopeptidase N